jgi:hypothetical protein
LALGVLCNISSVTKNHTAELLKIARKLGLLCPRDFQSAGIPRIYLEEGYSSEASS